MSITGEERISHELQAENYRECGAEKLIVPLGICNSQNQTLKEYEAVLRFDKN